MEPISRAATKDILKYLYEQGLLSSAYNEETEDEIISSVQKIIEKHYNY